MTSAQVALGIDEPLDLGVSRALEESAKAATKKPKRAPFVLAGILLASAVAGGSVWLNGRGKQSTDDAFVEAPVANVAPRIQGQVVRVLVKDNDTVKAGDVLVELDDRDARVRLATAQADLASAKANLAAAEAQLALTVKNVGANLLQARGGVVQASALGGTSRAGVDQAEADVEAAESRRRLAESELRRTEKLHADGAVSAAELDVRKAQFDQAVATVAQAKARAASAIESLGIAQGTLAAAQGKLSSAQTGPEQVEVARATVGVASARVAQAEALVEQAKLSLSYTQVKAEIGGVISRKVVEVGQIVDPSRPLLAITNLANVWVVANFKEDQISHIRPGQAVSIKVDAFEGRAIDGKVESLSGGSGARFSLLPPDNASGNFTKVVQRIPVRIHLDGAPDDVVLRPGMSTYVTVKTR